MFLRNVGGQISDLSEKVRLELGACIWWKVNETVFTNRPKRNPQERNGATVDSTFVRPDELVGEIIILTRSRPRAAFQSQR